MSVEERLQSINSVVVNSQKIGGDLKILILEQLKELADVMEKYSKTTTLQMKPKKSAQQKQKQKQCQQKGGPNYYGINFNCPSQKDTKTDIFSRDLPDYIINDLSPNAINFQD
jgi:Mor family transcriptional regulator